MLIDEWMTRRVHTLKPLDSIAHARELMVRKRVNQLPVLHDGRLVGIVTDRDLRDAFPSVFAEIDEAIAREEEPQRQRARVPETDPRRVTVDMVMSHAPLTIAPGERLEEAARTMRRERIGALPVVENDALVGILTRSDVLDAFLGLTSAMAEAPGA